jgi:uncharacterized membrane protein
VLIPRPTNGSFREWANYVWRTVLGYFVTGLLVWIPLMVTVWVMRLLINNPVLGIERITRDLFRHARDLGDRVPSLYFLTEFRYQPGIGVMLVVMIFLLTGILARYLLGRRLISTGERVLIRIPLVSRIYRATQQIRDVFMGRSGGVFQRVCVVEYPRPGLYAVAFVTSQEQGIVQDVIEKNMIAVFVPTTPNPTSGYLVYLPPDDVTYLDITVEEAMKLIVSGGAYIPGKDVESLDTRSNTGHGEAAEQPST